VCPTQVEALPEGRTKVGSRVWSNPLSEIIQRCGWEEGGLKIRALVVAAVAALSSLVVVPAASAAGEACYSVSLTVNGEAVVNEAGCQTLP
jgi:hypothetical protein